MQMFTHIFLPKKKVLSRVHPQICTAGQEWWPLTMRNNTKRCLGTINSMPRRFSSSPELMSNCGIVPETWKSARHRFFCTPTPTSGMPPCCISKYSTDCEIWELNSQYFVFCMQTRVRTEYTPKWDVFCAHTVLIDKYEILGVQRAYCSGNRV